MSEIEILQNEMSDIKTKLGDVYDILAQVNENLKTLNLGLYGDEKNNYPGVIKKQEILEQKIVLLEKEIETIKAVNIAQDIQLKAKKNIWNLVLDVVKWAGLAYLVLKGVFDVDNLFGKFF